MTSDQLISAWMGQLAQFPITSVVWMGITLIGMCGIKIVTGDSPIDMIIKLVAELRDLLKLRPTRGALNALLLILIVIVFVLEVPFSSEVSFSATQEAIRGGTKDIIADWMVAGVILAITGMWSIVVSTPR